MQEQTDTRPGRQQLAPIELAPGIYDFTPQIREHIADGTPLPDEISNVLKTFRKQYDLDYDIKERGKETLLNEIDSALRVFDLEEARSAVSEGVEHAQKINPDEKIKPFPVVFLFIPRMLAATALHGQGCAINIHPLVSNASRLSTPYEKIVSASAHESTHMFLQQLGKRPSEREKPLKEIIYDFLWEEGLATYMEPTTSKTHEKFLNNADFWLNIINRWLETNDPKVKNDLLRECIKPSYIEWRPNINNNLDDIFIQGFTRMTGIGYHIGSYLWKKQIEKGNSLKDLVLQGSGNMEKWIEEYK